jgi:hypothetical protein
MANVKSVVDFVSASGLPPATGMLYTLKMPLSLEENRILFPSAENEAPLTVVVAMNCSMEYCFSSRWLPEPQRETKKSCETHESCLSPILDISLPNFIRATNLRQVELTA